jgi:hypothetical protein
VAALIQKSLSKDLLGDSSLESDFHSAEIAVRCDTGHVCKLTLSLVETSHDVKLPYIQKLDRDQVNTGVIFAYNTWQGDPFGDIGRHCMYLRGYDQQSEKLIGHNSLGIFNPEVLVDMDKQRRLCFFQLDVAHLELMTGTEQDKKDYFLSNA